MAFMSTVPVPMILTTNNIIEQGKQVLLIEKPTTV